MKRAKRNVQRRLSGKPKVPSRRRRNFGGFLLTAVGLGMFYVRLVPANIDPRHAVSPAVGLILIIGGCLSVVGGFLLMASAAPGLLDMPEDLTEEDFEPADRSNNSAGTGSSRELVA